MAKLIRLEQGDQFKIFHGRHWGRTYTVEGFGYSKWGIKHAICRWADKPGDVELLTTHDLSEMMSFFRLWDTTARELNDREMNAATQPEAA